MRLVFRFVMTVTVWPYRFIIATAIGFVMSLFFFFFLLAISPTDRAEPGQLTASCQVTFAQGSSDGLGFGFGLLAMPPPV